MKAKSFILNQIGSLELTENMGGDPSFIIPVELSLETTEKIIVVDTVDCIYYHSSNGWTLMDKKTSTEYSVYEIFEEKNLDFNDEFCSKLNNAIDKLGSRILDRTIEIVNSLWGEHIPYETIHDTDTLNKKEN